MQLDLLKKDNQLGVVNVSSVPQRSIFRYPGGKTWFVPTFRHWMKSKSAKPGVLVEPFAGGGIIGLTAAFENLVEKVVLVELDEYVAAVWSILIDGEAEKLARKILNFELTSTNVIAELAKPPKDTFQKAFQTILRNRVSHGGIMAPGSGLIKNGENGKGISSRWYPETLAKRIRDIVQIREKITFIQGSAFDVIDDYIDDPKAAFFVDPPYTAQGKKAGRRLYAQHALDHDMLFDSFESSKSDFIFTYDDSLELREMAEIRSFDHQLIAMKNTHNTVMSELLIGRSLKWLRQ